MKPVVFLDAEQAVLTYLRARIPGLIADVMMPNTVDGTPRLALYRLGGTQNWPVTDAARFDVESWCSDRPSGHDLMQAVLGHLKVAQHVGGTYAGSYIYGCDIESGPQYFPDPVTFDHRWLSTVTVTLRPARTE